VDEDAELDNVVAFMILETFHRDQECEEIVVYPPYSEETADSTYAIKKIPRGGLVTTFDSHPDAPVPPLEWVDPSPVDGWATLEVGQALRCGFGWAKRYVSSRRKMNLSPKDIQLWIRAAAFIHKHDGPEVQFPQAFHPDSRDYRPRYPESDFHQALEDISTNFPKLNDSAGILERLKWLELVDYIFNFPVFGVVAAFLPVAYGGVHLSAWTFQFPTETELLLWKIACFDIMITIPTLLTFTLIYGFTYEWVPHDWLSFCNFHIINIPLNVVAGVCLLMYALSRSYLVVESFVSLRSVPIGVYWTPPWIQMLPHI